MDAFTHTTTRGVGRVVAVEPDRVWIDLLAPLAGRLWFAAYVWKGNAQPCVEDACGSGNWAIGSERHGMTTDQRLRMEIATAEHLIEVAKLAEIVAHKDLSGYIERHRLNAVRLRAQLGAIA